MSTPRPASPSAVRGRQRGSGSFGGISAEGNKSELAVSFGGAEWQHDGTSISASIDRPQAGRGERWRAAAVAMVAVVAVLYPLGRSLTRDSFPLSNYPMFTHNPGGVTGFQRAVGITADGGEVILSPQIVGGTVEVIHAAQTIATALREGRGAGLCAEIAGRVAGSGSPAVEVLVVTDRFDIVDGLRAEVPRPIDRAVHATCEVPR